ncbi:type 1 glutamine amidotransferase [Sphingomonas sabuli]|uniref:Type 1 glutamine amidotransferase n=1 Tax=Sphingomonas sabuli TaxID=2764186 RepID=A0A7G9L4D4_9SPHN|nr:type 1 glutamine amidotransferase domain-containing protein [Sphingomonas sabuli]QNM83483.1 type 1 glutamine amidotransferase [Sphingomonas sabuli]
MPDIAAAKILIVATDGFEQSELFGPREILLERGAKVSLASLEMKAIQGTVHDKPGKTIEPDLLVEDAKPSDYDALVLPGGVGNPDKLRGEKAVIDLIKQFDGAGKPVAAICHGPWLLVEADLVDGKTVTSWPSIRTDLKNAGGNVVDQEVAIDGNIITSRKPDDVDAFTNAVIDAVEKAEAGASA